MSDLSRIEELATLASVAYGQLWDATSAKASAELKLTAAKSEYSVHKNLTLLSETIDGRNAEIRGAQLAVACAGHQQVVDDTEAEVKAADLALERAKLEIRDVSMQVRLHELKARYLELEAAQIEGGDENE